jgi:hypothetical protein
MVVKELVNKGKIRDPSDEVRDSSRSPVDSSHQILKHGACRNKSYKSSAAIGQVKTNMKQCSMTHAGSTDTTTVSAGGPVEYWCYLTGGNGI